MFFLFHSPSPSLSLFFFPFSCYPPFPSLFSVPPTPIFQTKNISISSKSLFKIYHYQCSLVRTLPMIKLSYLIRVRILLSSSEDDTVLFFHLVISTFHSSLCIYILCIQTFFFQKYCYTNEIRLFTSHGSLNIIWPYMVFVSFWGFWIIALILPSVTHKVHPGAAHYFMYYS